MIFVKLFLTLALTMALLNSSQAASISASQSVSISTSVSTQVSLSFSTQPSILLVAPGQVQNSCPGQRTMLCLYWTEPSGLFYPSFNLYYRVQGAATFTIISNIQALSYVLDDTEINASTTYEVTVTGVTYSNAESPQAPPNTFTTSTPDPRDNPQAGVSGIMFTAGVKSISYSYTQGTAVPQQLNFRAKCTKSNGRLYTRKETVFQPKSSDTFTIFKTGSTCKARIRIKYFDENTNDNAEPRFGPKMKWVTGLKIQ